jgi:2-polyprenyl-3-methyl-5-hydroxy-6-metoxy-1,4-benzoquinol methylase
MAQAQTIKEYIRALEHMLAFLHGLLDEEKSPLQGPETDSEKLKEITELRMLAKSDRWPLAVPEELICADDEESKLGRAAGIISDFMQKSINGSRFLDFGCGEGHVVNVASNLFGVRTAVGYDLKDQDWKHFEPHSRQVLTTEWAVVKKHGPYDNILINDVLDHAENPKQIMQQVREVLSPVGKVFLRCHPWTSRHGSHLYKQLNRAYLHLVFSTDELYQMGLTEMPTSQLIDPLSAYQNLIKDAGFTIMQEEKITHPVEIFFTHHSAILRRIKSRWAMGDVPTLADGTDFPRDIIETQFVDYVLI